MQPWLGTTDVHARRVDAPGFERRVATNLKLGPMLNDEVEQLITPPAYPEYRVRYTYALHFEKYVAIRVERSS